MNGLGLYMRRLDIKAVTFLLVSLLATVTGCNLNQGAGEQMVNLEKVTDDPEAKLANLTAAIKRNKQDGSLYTRRAIVLLQEQEYEKALIDIDEAIKLNRNDLTNLFVKAQVLRGMKKPKEALDQALLAERNSMVSASLYILISDLYLQLQQPQKAAEYVSKAQELAPGNQFTLYYRGRVAAATGDTARAARSYSIAVQKSPAFAEARRELAGTLVNLKQYAEAGEQVKIVLKQMPSDGMVWYYKGELYLADQKPDSALWSFRKALTFADSLQNAQYRAGMLLYAQGDNAGAIAHLEKAAKNYNKQLKYITTLANAYERTGQNIKALEQYQRLVALEPGYSFAHQSIARLKAKLTRPMPVVTTDTTSINEIDNNITSQ